jgi:hypothetical protein
MEETLKQTCYAAMLVVLFAGSARVFERVDAPFSDLVGCIPVTDVQWWQPLLSTMRPPNPSRAAATI